MRYLKDSESKQVIKDFVAQYSSSVDYLKSVKHIQALKVEDTEVFFVAGNPWILRTKSRLFPSLKFYAVLSALPRVIIDMGAIPYVANGAPIMRPGIRQIEGDFKKDDLIAIQDEKYRKVIALGIAETDSEIMRSMTKGRVIENIHYVGDELWNSFTITKQP